MSDSAWKGLLTNFIIVFMLLSLAVVSFTGGSVMSVSNGGLQPIYSGNTSRAEVCFMFNVYGGEEYLADIADVFLNYGMTTTFFIGGCWAAKNVGLVKKLSAAGFEIANHGYTHKNHAKLSASENHKEIMLTESLITSVTGKTSAKLFAPPSGYIGDNMLTVCENEGIKVIMWTRDTVDWRDKSAPTVFCRAVNNLKNGDLILMHPTAHTLEALPLILDYCVKNGFAAVCASRAIGR